MARLGILFAGQGSQHAGMGIAWETVDPAAGIRLADASKVLGYDLRDLLTTDDGRLNDTLYAQPAIVVASLIGYHALVAESRISPAAFAGFSLGEWTALGAASIFAEDRLLKLVKLRAEAMHAAADAAKGGMAAIIGLDAASVEEMCRKASTTAAVVVCANWNCPGQVVVSGHAEAVLRVVELARLAGAKRAVMLNVSGAFHSPLMRSAARRMAGALLSAVPRPASALVWSNVTGRPYQDGELKMLLAKQIVSPVRFETSIRTMIASGITHFLEIGPGTTLTGFVRKIAPDLPAAHLDGPEELGTVKGWLHEHGLDK